MLWSISRLVMAVVSCPPRSQPSESLFAAFACMLAVFLRGPLGAPCWLSVAARDDQHAGGGVGWGVGPQGWYKDTIVEEEGTGLPVVEIKISWQGGEDNTPVTLLAEIVSWDAVASGVVVEALYKTQEWVFTAWLGRGEIDNAGKRY